MEAKEHQKRVAEKLKSVDGQILYWGLGSGKTYGAINAANALNIPATVITPASLQENFKKEIKKAKSKNKFDIMSYDKFIRGQNIKYDDALILDEAHRIRNTNTERARQLKKIAPTFGKRILLTGTPIQNSPSELAPLVNLAAGETRLPEDPKVFNDMFLKEVSYTPSAIERFLLHKQPTYTTELQNTNRLKAAVRNLVDYYEYRNPADYPETAEETIKIPMTPDQINTYNIFERRLLDRALRKKLNSSAPWSSRDAQRLNAFLNATRQISNTPNKYLTNPDTPLKVQRIVDAVKNTDGPSLIYSNYLDSGVRPVAEELNKNKISYGLFTGELSSKQKKELVDNYNKGKLKALLVSSSGGEGLDLKNTRGVHIMEPHWHNPKIDQVIGRAIRFKSHESLPTEKRNVKIYKYLSTFPEKPSLLGIKRTPRRTADEVLNDISIRKDKINKMFLDILKEEGQS